MEAASQFLSVPIVPSPPLLSPPSSLCFLRRDSTTNSPRLKPPSTFSVRASAGVYNNPMVTLLDYGAGNVRSVRNAIRSLGFDIKDVQSPKTFFMQNDSFSLGLVHLLHGCANAKGDGYALCTYIENDRPFLGICLGLQLLFESSEENGPGQGSGFEIDLINLVSDAVNIPVIARSGAGKVEHFSEVFRKTNASAAGIFHRKEVY